ncbi:urea carboxylase-associated family protein [Microtetraspora malaysiensis]|uniref:urea carboxylase-associated family protein n=1 Tax=Microtetraspora malaysiensis TaxID=161358 RepID=UPI003D8A6695
MSASIDNAPAAAYVTGEGSPLRTSSSRCAALARTAGRELVHEEVIPVRSGAAWHVPAGHVCRFTTIEGPQVLDLNIWHRDDPRERFWAARTRQFHGAHVTVGDRLWSTLPFLRPLATVVADSIGYEIDEHGAGCHDLLGTRCDPYANQLLSGTVYDFHCHSNLVRAVLPYGLTEFDVHDVINLFQVTGLRPDDERYFMKSSPARPGDHFELFAETDLLMAASTCPGGDLSAPLWGPGSDAEPRRNPIKIEVFRLSDEVLHGWAPSARVGYRGAGSLRHGLREPAPGAAEARPLTAEA